MGESHRIGKKILGELASVVVLVSALSHAGMAAASPDPTEIGAAVRDLGSNHDRAVAAAYVLQSGGADAAHAILEAWPSLSTLARRRAITPLRSLAETHPAAVQALVEAARSDDERVRVGALDALRATPHRKEALSALLGDRASVADRAALVLARSEPDFAIARLLAVLAEPGGEDRPAIREALVVAVARADSPDSALRAWLRTDPPAPAVASAALGLSSLEGHRETVAHLASYAMRGADDFPTAWRLLRSVRGAASSPAIDRWVLAQLSTPPEWMLRAEAVEAIAARGSPEQARVGLRDPYPRVRSTAATVLSGEASSLTERATLARRDLWPMVRAAAVKSLRNEPDALPVVVASIDDSMSVVRVAAIEALTGVSHDAGWERIHARLRDADEWPEVTAAAIAYVAAHCRADAAESLFRVVMRAAPSHASTEDLNNAARAVEALKALETQESDAVVERLQRTPGVPPTLKMALERSLPEAARCPSEAP